MQYATEPQLSTAPLDEVAARRQLRAVREAGIEAPTGEIYFNAAEWIRELDDDGPWRASVMKVARVLAKLFDDEGTASAKHREIAKRAKLGLTATEDALRELDRDGWLRRFSESGRPSVYTACFRRYHGHESPRTLPKSLPKSLPRLARARAKGL
jgi:hypothetical protein